MSWIIDNKQWLFSGAGLAVVGYIYSLWNRKPIAIEPEKNTATNKNHIEINVGERNHSSGEKTVNDNGHKKA